MLRVWLPLTKDLRNQGLSDCAVEEITSPVFDSNGKLGKALSEGKIRIPASKVGDIFNNNTMTVAFWYNNNTSNTSGNHAICGFSGNGEGDTDAVRIWDFFNYSVPTQFHWSMGTLGGGSLANAFPANTWVHVCVTWSAPTLKIYLDGVLKYTGSGSSDYTFNKSYYISFGHTPQKLNDFRIYDHCLSPMEVKELSKGLVLHYPLNRGGWGQENLLPGTNLGTTSWNWTMQAGNYTTAEETTLSGVRGCKFTRGTTAQSGWSVIFYNNINESLFKASTKYKLSVDIYPSVNTNFVVSIRESNGTNVFANAAPAKAVTANKWNHLEFDLTTVATLPSSTGETIYFQSMDSSTGVSYIFRNLKLEEGEIATPWCPNSSDALATTMGLNSTTEYDCSGFCNNGTRTGTFSWTSDTPKYQVSTKFSDSSYIKYKGPESMYQATYAFWVKSASYTSYNMIHGPLGSPSAGTSPWLSVNTESSGAWAYFGNNSPNYTKASGTISTNAWHHLVYVWDNGVAKWYIDGVPSSNAVTYTTRTFIQNTAESSIGDSYTGTSWSGTPFTGQLSDFRVYATALSADDVKSLYQNSAYIDSSGNVYGAVHSEV